jgi:hypothetical protein
MPRSFSWSLSFTFSHQNPVCTLFCTICATCPALNTRLFLRVLKSVFHASLCFAFLSIMSLIMFLEQLQEFKRMYSALVWRRVELEKCVSVLIWQTWWIFYFHWVSWLKAV